MRLKACLVFPSAPADLINSVPSPCPCLTYVPRSPRYDASTALVPAQLSLQTKAEPRWATPGGTPRAQLTGGERRPHVVGLLGLWAICPTLSRIAVLSPSVPCGSGWLGGKRSCWWHRRPVSKADLMITSVEGTRLGVMNFQRSVRLSFIFSRGLCGFTNLIFGAASLPEVWYQNIG